MTTTPNRFFTETSTLLLSDHDIDMIHPDLTTIGRILAIPIDWNTNGTIAPATVPEVLERVDERLWDPMTPIAGCFEERQLRLLRGILQTARDARQPLNWHINPEPEWNIRRPRRIDPDPIGMSASSLECLSEDIFGISSLADMLAADPTRGLLITIDPPLIEDPLWSLQADRYRELAAWLERCTGIRVDVEDRSHCPAAGNAA